MAGEATVTVPVVGTVERKWVYVGAAVVAVIVAGAYVLRRRASATTYAADPATGSLADGTVYDNPSPTHTVDDTVQSDPDLITTDDGWSRVVVEDLAGLGWNEQYAAITLGRYLAGQQLDEDQANLVRTAWGLRGRPPSGQGIVLAQTQPQTPAPTTPTPAPPPSAPTGTSGAKKFVHTTAYTKTNTPWNSTLSGIARHEGTTVANLMQLNPWIKDPNVIGSNVDIRVK